jgi:hypothetical protein
VIDIIGRVHRFQNALRQAIHDRELEQQGEELHYFFDADVVLGTAIGLTSFDPNTAPDVSDLRYVVRALLSTGYLPPIRLLSSHLVEFDHAIRRLDAPKPQRGFEQELRKALIRRWGIADNDAALRKSMKSANGLYDFLQEHGFGVFVKLELCMGGTWQTRLARMMRAGLFRLRTEGAPRLPAQDDSNLRAFARTLSEIRPRFSLQNDNDAYALTELVSKLDEGIRARFYTQTAGVRHALSEFATSSAAIGDPLLVQREEEYFILRCSFPALGFANLTLHGGGTGPIGLHEWRQLCSQLDELLQSLHTAQEGDAAVHRALHTTAIGGIGLGDLVEQFYNLGFLDSVFLTWTPERMEEWLPSLSRARTDAANLAAVSQKLRRSLDELWSTLDHEAAKLRTWQDVLRRVLDASEARARMLEGRYPSLDLDLGLGRWGIIQQMDPATTVRLETGIASLLDERRRAAAAADLAASFSQPATDLQELATHICLLWFLRLDELIILAFANAREIVSAGSLPAWLTLFETFALVRTAGRWSNRRNKTLQAELSDIVRRMEEVVAAEHDPSWNEGFAQMGMAHVCYLVWRILEQHHYPDVTYARRSFDAARSACARFVHGSLEWTFAVNHCAYIGIESGLYPEESGSYAQALVQRLPKFHNHYRFVDTVVRLRTRRIAREVEQHGVKALTSPPFKALRKQLCEELAHSGMQLREHLACGDDEVLMHVQSIESYRSALQC